MIFSIALFLIGCIFGFLGLRTKSLFLELGSATVISFSLLGMAHSIRMGVLVIEVPLMLLVLGFSFFMLYYGVYVDQVVVGEIKQRIKELKKDITMAEQAYISKRISKAEMTETIKKLESQIADLERVLDKQHKLNIYARFCVRERYALEKLERK